MGRPILTNLLLFLSILTFGQEKSGHVTISNELLNIFYRGIENPMSVTVENHSCDHLLIKSSNSRITGNKCEYNVTPGSGNQVTIDIFRTSVNDTLLLHSYNFLVHDVPIPNAYFGKYTKADSTIRKSKIFDVAGVMAEHEKFVKYLQLSVESYDLTIRNSDSTFVAYHCTDGRLPSDFRKNIRGLEYGTIIEIVNIQVKGPNELRWMSAPIRLRIIE